jgi:hypothetical protein
LRKEGFVEWRTWSCDGQVGGYLATYKQLIFATVRAAGHMVGETGFSNHKKHKKGSIEREVNVT